MKKELSRLALLQMMLVVYATLGVAVILKVHYAESVVPSELFATKVRDGGFLLLLFPASWGVWALFAMGEPEEDIQSGVALLMSGVGVAVLLSCVALVASISAVMPYHTELPNTEPPKLHGHPLPEGL